MKKLFAILIMVSMILSFSAPAFGAKDSSVIHITLDGKEISSDVAPQIVNGRTFVPIRFVAVALGAKVSWDDKTRSAEIIKGTDQYVLYIGGDALKNRAMLPIDVSPFIVSGRTMVPLRFIAEAFGCSVTWNDSNKTVSIASTAGSTGDSTLSATIGSTGDSTSSTTTIGSTVNTTSSGSIKYIDQSAANTFKVQLLVGVVSIRIGLLSGLSTDDFTAEAEVNGEITELVPNASKDGFDGVQLEGTNQISDEVTVTVTKKATNDKATFILPIMNR